MADEKKTVETDETAGKAKHFATTTDEKTDEKTETEVKADVEVKPDETEKPEEPKEATEAEKTEEAEKPEEPAADDSDDTADKSNVADAEKEHGAEKHDDSVKTVESGNSDEKKEKSDKPEEDSETDGKKHHGKTIALVIVIILAILLAGAGGYMLWKSQQPVSDPGATIQSYDGKTTKEIQDELNRQAEESRMTISVAPKVRIKDGKARVNVINANDNKFDQTFTLEQDGKDVYKSGIIKVGEKVEWCDAADLKTGTATITVQAVDKKSGKPSGNPQSVSVEVVNDTDSEE